MKSLIAELISLASAEDSAVQDEAILRLERCSWNSPVSSGAPEYRSAQRGEYNELVPSEVLVDIDESTERRILGALAAVARSSRFKLAILWAMGKAKPHLACFELLDLIADCHKTFDPEALWQGVAALDNCFTPKIAAVRRCFQDHRMRMFLEVAMNCPDEPTRQAASRLLAKLPKAASTDSS